MFFIALVNLQLNSTVFFLLTINRPLTGHKSHLRIPVFWWFFFCRQQNWWDKSFHHFFLKRRGFCELIWDVFFGSSPWEKERSPQELEKFLNPWDTLVRKVKTNHKNIPPKKPQKMASKVSSGLPPLENLLQNLHTQPFKNEHVTLKKGWPFQKTKVYIYIDIQSSNPSFLFGEKNLHCCFLFPARLENRLTVTHLDLGSPLSRQHVPLDKSFGKNTRRWWCGGFFSLFFFNLKTRKKKNTTHSSKKDGNTHTGSVWWKCVEEQTLCVYFSFWLGNSWLHIYFQGR